MIFLDIWSKFMGDLVMHFTSLKQSQQMTFLLLTSPNSQ